MVNANLIEAKLSVLRELTAVLGADPLLAQASTGNTSIKINGALFIKASGKWLADAASDDFFVGLDLEHVRHLVASGEDIPDSAVKWGSGRPSIETAMHAVLPHEVVVHVHSVNTIAWAIREDGPLEISRLFRGVRWAWIPYTESGVPLAQAVDKAFSSEPATDVFVLGNHGLVVCGPSCSATRILLNDIESRIRIQGRRLPEPNWYELKRAACGSDWIVPAANEVHALATDGAARRLLSGGALYPCQLIFLPDTIATDSLPIKQFRRRNQGGPILLTDVGVLLRKSVSAEQQALLQGLIEVVRRVDAQAPIRYLTPSEALRVLNGPDYLCQCGCKSKRHIADASN